MLRKCFNFFSSTGFPSFSLYPLLPYKLGESNNFNLQFLFLSNINSVIEKIFSMSSIFLLNFFIDEFTIFLDFKNMLFPDPLSSRFLATHF